jgi:hypothetical protein
VFKAWVRAVPSIPDAPLRITPPAILGKSIFTASSFYGYPLNSTSLIDASKFGSIAIGFDWGKNLLHRLEGAND